MSQFFKALERAERERALRQQAGEPRTAIDPPTPLESPPPLETKEPEPTRRPVTPEEFDGMDPHLVSLLAPTTFEAEQYRVLRHLIEQMRQETSTQVIGVSSPGVGDGKTTTAVNLAGALAQAPDVRVLLVEADLRRPALARPLGLPEEGIKGVVDLILYPHLPFDAAAVRLPQYNLSILLAGSVPPAPYELLKSPRVARLFEEARRQFDYVVVDTPPVIPLPDCRLLKKWVERFILVVCAHRTPRRSIQESLEVIDPAKILGLVFNADERAGAAYSRYYEALPGDGTGRGPKRIGAVIRRRSSRLAR